MMQQGPAMAAPHPPMAQNPMDQQYQHQQHQQQQQPWMMMPHQQQAPQPQQMWPQQPPQQNHQPPQYQQPSGSEEVRTLWIGDLQYWMDENYIRGCFDQTGEVVSVKIIRNKQTMQSEGYGFIEFNSHATAERVLQTYNNTLMPNVEQNYRLNRAFYGSGEKRGDDTPEHTVFVGDLAADVNDYTLQETFRAHYQSVKGAKVVIDRLTGRSKGYGFVRFGDESEQVRAMSEMNGVMCSGRAMRVGAAASKKNAGGTGCQEALSFRGLGLISAEMVTPIVCGLA